VIALHVFGAVVRFKPFHLAAAAFAVLALLSAPAAWAADIGEGWGRWWLPPNRSEHGGGMDSLFTWIFWITMVTFILVELVLIIFIIKYRYRPERKKAVFTHGNTRLEMAWTIAPAIILAVLAMASKKVWDNYRYSPSADDPNRAQILVIGQQFKWNVVYPGPDRKIGRYLAYPSPTDTKWPDGKNHAGAAGPAFLPYERAMGAIRTYIATENPIGKDVADPDGADDDWSKTAGREIYVPAHRPVQVHLTSMDVIHSFFLPNFRVKLDTVPGMRGHVFFTATMTSKEREAASLREYTIEELSQTFARQPRAEYTVVINENRQTEGAELYKPRRGPAFWRYAANDQTIIRDGGLLSPDNVAKLKDAGIETIWAFEPGYWEIVCEELCGQGHSTMKGKMVVLDPEEYRQRFEGGTTPAIAASD